MVDIDWNSDRVDWSKPKPMNSEENMLKNAKAIHSVDPSTITWVYRNGIKALPWATDVRVKLQDKAYWGWFMAKKGCNPSPGELLPASMLCCCFGLAQRWRRGIIGGGF